MCAKDTPKEKEELLNENTPHAEYIVFGRNIPTQARQCRKYMSGRISQHSHPKNGDTMIHDLRKP